MHGAALSYAALLPPHAAVLELWPKNRDMWRCFEHLSTMAGMLYARWENTDHNRFRVDDKGDYTRVDVDAFTGMYRVALGGVRARINDTLAGRMHMS